MRNLRNAALLALMMVLSVGVQSSYAQEEEITDKELWKYAMMELVIKEMIDDISVEVNNMIKAQEGMDGRRFKELSATKGNKAALDALGAQEFEVKFLQLVEELKEERKEAIKVVKTELAKKMVGSKGRTYKKIEDELKSNPELKERYDKIVAQLEFTELDAL
jgi:hypothetical protein